MELIDKSALIVEIERRATFFLNESKKKTTLNDSSCAVALYGLLSFLDTLEVKEVKEEPVSKDLEEAIDQSFIYHNNHGDDFRSDKQIETAYRCGFETGVKWKELTSSLKI